MNFKDPKECLHFLERQCEKFRENIHAREILNLNYDDNQTIETIDEGSVEWRNFVGDIEAYLEAYPSPDNEIQIKNVLYKQPVTEQVISELETLLHRMNNRLSIEETKEHNAVESNSLEEASDVVNNNVFVVHGHDNEVKNVVARFLEKQGLYPIILHERPNEGQTLIEKIERCSDVGFAIVLYTPCDQGRSADEEELHNRARQNVILEHGFLMGKLGRDKVCALVKGDIEKPSDIDGIVYIAYDAADGWQLRLAEEMRAAGYSITL